MYDTPAPFTEEDYTARMTRAARDAAEAGLTGVLITPGPDLTCTADEGRRLNATDRGMAIVA